MRVRMPASLDSSFIAATYPPDRSAVAFFEIQHEFPQSITTGRGHGIVPAGPQSPDTSMPLEFDQLVGLGLFQESVVEGFISQRERDVHPGSVLWRHRVV